MDRRTFVSSCVATAGVFALPGIGAPRAARKVVSLDVGWRFQRGDFDGAQAPGYNDSSWRLLDVPHDWSIEGPFSPDNPSRGSGGFATTGIGWYRRAFALDAAAKDRRIAVEFDGVYENCTVWLNGHEIGVQRYGYSSFQFDLTPHVRFGGDNVLAVRVDNSRQPNCRWYSGSGIYRHVRLINADPLHVAHWGTWVTTPEVTEDVASVRVRTTVRNDYGSTTGCRIKTTVLGPDGNSAGEELARFELSASANHEFDQSVKVASPKLWSPESPQLYRVRTQLMKGDTLVDEYETPFGIRTAEFNKDRGFLLNGEPVTMKGVCLHHDGGSVGAAVPVRVWERRLEILRSIGCNAIRTAHNPHAPEFLDLCDRLGFLVIDEVYDKWDNSKAPWNPIEFADRWQDDMRSFYERDRNHPSIILWSVGNETGEPGDENMIERLIQLIAYARRLDPTRPHTSALIAVRENVSNEEKLRRLLKTADHVDVLCLNYQEQWFEKLRAARPNLVMVSTEAFAYYRGGQEELMVLDARNPWYDIANHDYAVGQFLWPGIDYLGESMGWPSKGWPTGIIDTCGFLKPMAGFHRTVWSDEPSVRMAVQHDSIDRDNGREQWGWPKLAAHWNWEQLYREPLRLHIFTNCETVELQVNGKSLGVRPTAGSSNNTLVWHTAYVKGTVEAIGRNGDQIVARDQLVTAGKPDRIELVVDRDRITADGEDVSHVEVRLLDEKGVLVQTDERRVTLKVEGAGRLIGVDNGDLRDPDSYQAASRTTRSGRCLAIVQSLRNTGAIRVTARAEGISSDSTEITVA
jgi:beta-galactosidase